MNAISLTLFILLACSICKSESSKLYNHAFLGDDLVAEWPEGLWRLYFERAAVLRAGHPGANLTAIQERVTPLLERFIYRPPGICPGVLMISAGTRDLRENASCGTITNALIEVERRTHARCPETRVEILSILPSKSTSRCVNHELQLYYGSGRLTSRFIHLALRALDYDDLSRILYRSFL